jgi:uncharacterized membrane protein YgdD (TMEM256/DUF423 family)
VRDRLVACCALSGAVAVLGGAFAAHGASGAAADWLRIGGQYEGLHAVAALVALQFGHRRAAVVLLGGSMLFAASLYALALGAPRWAGAITPVGGIAMVAGWLLLAWQAGVRRRPE